MTTTIDWTNADAVLELLGDLPPLPKPLMPWPKFGVPQRHKLYETSCVINRCVGYDGNWCEVVGEEWWQLANRVVELHDLATYVALSPFHVPQPAAAGNADFSGLVAHLAYVQKTVELLARKMIRPPAWVLLDCETFNAHQPELWQTDAVVARLNLVYGLIKSQWPAARISWFGQGSSTWMTDAFSWGPMATTVPPAVRGDAWSTGIYKLDERYLTREEMRRILATAEAAGVSQVLAWLGFGYHKRFDWTQKTWGSFLPYGQDGRYEPARDDVVWELGWETTAKLLTSKRSAWVDWSRVPALCAWPSPWTGNGLAGGGWWRNWLAFVHGAASVPPPWATQAA